MTTTEHAGAGRLQFVRAGSRTVLAQAFARSPAKLMQTGRGDTACWVYMATLGGGLVGGDEIRLAIDVGDAARALVTTQASTKVYRSTRSTRQEIDARVGAGGLLAMVPDPVVCFTDADFHQHQRFALARDASLVAVDWLTSGRHAAGERWAFRRYESRLDVRRAGCPVLYDAVALERRFESVLDRLGGFNVIGTLVLTGPLVSEPATAIRREIGARSIAPGCEAIVSASPLADGGTLLRTAATSVEDAGRTLRAYLSFLRPLVGDDLWSRKW